MITFKYLDGPTFYLSLSSSTSRQKLFYRWMETNKWSRVSPDFPVSNHQRCFQLLHQFKSGTSCLFCEVVSSLSWAVFKQRPDDGLLSQYSNRSQWPQRFFQSWSRAYKRSCLPGQHLCVSCYMEDGNDTAVNRTLLPQMMFQHQFKRRQSNVLGRTGRHRFDFQLRL